MFQIKFIILDISIIKLISWSKLKSLSKLEKYNRYLLVIIFFVMWTFYLIKFNKKKSIKKSVKIKNLKYQSKRALVDPIERSFFSYDRRVALAARCQPIVEYIIVRKTEKSAIDSG